MSEPFPAPPEDGESVAATFTPEPRSRSDCSRSVLSETILAIGRQLKDMVSPLPDKQQVSERSTDIQQ